MPAVYEKLGLRFLYPESWQITDEQFEDWPHTVSVQSPGSAFWSLHVYTADVEPNEAADEVLQAMRREYADLEAESVNESIGSTNAVGYDMDFYCLDFVVASRTRSFTHQGQTFVMLCQAEDREFAELENVFRAMTASLLGQQESDDSSNGPHD
jgi:hypothetical protein